MLDAKVGGRFVVTSENEVNEMKEGLEGVGMMEMVDSPVQGVLGGLRFPSTEAAGIAATISLLTLLTSAGSTQRRQCVCNEPLPWTSYRTT